MTDFTVNGVPLRDAPWCLPRKLARIVYLSPGLGMGPTFSNVEDQHLARLDRCLCEPPKEY